MTKEPFAWRRLPSVAARESSARHAAARFGAYDTFFLVSGEWHAEVRTRDNVTDDEIYREFVAIGDALAEANPHGRMVGVHPMTGHGSVREFTAAAWMSFTDYQQNYADPARSHRDVAGFTWTCSELRVRLLPARSERRREA